MRAVVHVPVPAVLAAHGASVVAGVGDAQTDLTRRTKRHYRTVAVIAIRTDMFPVEPLEKRPRQVGAPRYCLVQQPGG